MMDNSQLSRRNFGLINGTAGVIVTMDGEPMTMMGFIVTEGKIFEFDAIAEPERVRKITAAVLADE